MMCDFCQSREVYASHDCDGHQTPGFDAGFFVVESGFSFRNWCACRDCHNLIVASRRDDLLERSLATIPLDDFARDMLPATVDVVRGYVAEVHAGFWTYRSGDWHELPVSLPFVDLPVGKFFIDFRMDLLRKVDEPWVTLPLPTCVLLTDVAPQRLAARLAPCDKCNVQKWLATCQQPVVECGVPKLCKDCAACYLSTFGEVFGVDPTETRRDQ